MPTAAIKGESIFLASSGDSQHALVLQLLQAEGKHFRVLTFLIPRQGRPCRLNILGVDGSTTCPGGKFFSYAVGSFAGERGSILALSPPLRLQTSNPSCARIRAAK